MSEAVRFENVTKRFFLHQYRPHSLKELAFSLLYGNGWRWKREEIIALDNVSFVVEEGETLGIIGPNGSGKSTILKLIARVLEPTVGHINVKGKVSGLLELGAAFHPDLTGRENIYLNGAVLGFNREEMKRKFHDIVAFSELEKFIDIPLRQYSSGMYMRLGFAIAISAEPDILLVDEVLAVGDEHFQHKCLARISELRKRGVTILLVSHDLHTIQHLCEKTIWLEGGVIKAQGETCSVINKYLDKVAEKESAQQSTPAKARSEGKVKITKVEFLNEAGQVQKVFETGEKMIARIYFSAAERVEKPLFGIAITRNDGVHINGSNTRTSDYHIDYIEGEGAIDYIVEFLPLLNGIFNFTAVIYDYTSTRMYAYYYIEQAFWVRARKVKEKLGTIYIPCHWELRLDRQERKQ